jgi:hypothetical protein
LPAEALAKAGALEQVEALQSKGALL